MEWYKYEVQGQKFFYIQMLNYGDFHPFVNSFWFGLKAFLKKPQLLYVDQNIKKQKPKLKG